MDDNNRPRQPPVYPVSNQRFPQAQGQGQPPNPGQQQGRSYAGSSSDRFRPPPLQTSSSSGRGLGGSGAPGGYGYYNEGSSSTFSGALPTANPMQQYQSDYTPEHQQRQQQQQPQSFGSYNPNIMYNVPQQTQPVYDAQQFQPRQPAAMQMLSDVPAPYNFPPEAANAAQPQQSVLHHQQVPSASSAVYGQQNPADRSSLLQGYPNNMGSMSGIPQNAPSVPPEIMEEQQPQYAPANMQQAYDSYHTTLKEIFQNIRSGILVDASQSLLQISEWLLTNVGELGMLSFLCFSLLTVLLLYSIIYNVVFC